MSVLAPTYARFKEPCEWYAATQKHGKYDASFVGTNYFFSAMIFETLGGVNAEGEEVLRMLFRFAAKRLGREFTSYCGRAWARFNLQRSVRNLFLFVSTVKTATNEMICEQFFQTLTCH